MTDPTAPAREQTLAPRSAIAFLFVTVLMSIVGFGIVIPVMPELLEELTGKGPDESAALQGYLLGVYGFMQLVMSPILGALSDRFGRRPVILTSVAATSLDFLLMALAPTSWWLFVGRALSGATAATYASARSEERRVGKDDHCVDLGGRRIIKKGRRSNAPAFLLQSAPNDLGVVRAKRTTSCAEHSMSWK